jgi:hypothetical protein
LINAVSRIASRTYYTALSLIRGRYT